MLRALATGHRWETMGTRRTAVHELQLEALARAFLAQLQPDEAISGLAMGWDTAWAKAAISLGIPLVAAVPESLRRQTDAWLPADQATHRHLVIQAARVEIIGEGYAFGRACELRDRWMVDEGHVVAALWNGRASGTSKTIRFAQARGLPVVNLWGLHVDGAVKSGMPAA